MNPKNYLALLFILGAIAAAAVGFNVLQGVQNQQLRQKNAEWARLYEEKGREVAGLREDVRRLDLVKEQLESDKRRLEDANQELEATVQELRPYYQYYLGTQRAAEQQSQQAQNDPRKGIDWGAIAGGILKLAPALLGS